MDNVDPSKCLVPNHLKELLSCKTKRSIKKWSEELLEMIRIIILLTTDPFIIKSWEDQKSSDGF